MFDLEGLLLVAGVLIAAAVLSWPFLGLVAIVAAIPIEALATGDGAVPTLKALALLVSAGWTTRYILRGDLWRRPVPPGIAPPTLLFLVMCFASALWAIYPDDALAGFMSLCQLVIISVLVADLSRDVRRLGYVVLAVLGGGVVASIATISQFYVLGHKRAGDGVAGGVNGTAAILVSLMPLAAYAVGSERNSVSRGLGLAYLVMAPIAVFLTFSRSAWMVMGALTAYAMIRLVKSSGLRGVIVAVALVTACVVSTPRTLVTERASTIVPVITSAFTNDHTQKTDSRGYHHRVGREMLADAPLYGVGYNNYPRAFRFIYQFRVPGAEGYYASLRSPHSTYVGLAAETGLIGVFLWMAIVLSAIRRMGRLTLLSRSAQLRHFRTALATCLFAQLIFGFTTTVHLTKMFWVFVGLSAVLAALPSPIVNGSRTSARSDPLSTFA